MLFFTLISFPTLPPIQVRFKSVAKPFQVRSLEWMKNGTCIDFGRDLHRWYLYKRWGLY